MDNNKLDIKKTKYRYLMDNLKLFPIKPIMKYTIPVPKDPTIDESKQEFFDRNYPDVTITNLHFKHMIDKTAKALVAMGIKKGDIVTICQTNTPEMFYMDYALNKIGAIPNYIYPNVTADEMKYYIDELDSKYMFILDDAPIRKNVKQATDGTGIKIISSSVIESFPQLFKMVASKKMPKEEPIKLENEIKWEEFIKNGKNALVLEDDYVPNSVCSYVHSSGTSSIPKAIMISNENANCVPYNYEVDKVKWNEGKLGVQTIPQFVQFGSATTQLLLCNNVCIVIIPEMEPKNYYDLIEKYKPSYSFATPSHARELVKRPVDMSNSKILGFGGDGFDDIEKNLNEYIKINGGNSYAYQGYGSTEMSAVAVVNTPKTHKVGSLGKPIGDTKAIIIDTDSEPGNYNIINEPNKIGELCLTGSGVTLGYAGNSKDQNEKVFVKHSDGRVYVHMGDFISKDEDGFLYYHGRIKNVITRKSFTFSPDEIVKAIMKHPKVKQCVVIPKYSKEEGETPSAHIVLNDYENKEQTLSEIIDLVNQNVQEFHRPTDYKIRDQIVRTRNNKNNITALKIEDTASMYVGVIDSKIETLDDGTYDYCLNISLDSKYNSDIESITNEIDDYLREISNILKFEVGKIKYNIKVLDVNYSDSDQSFEKSQIFVKHI